ncbi:hypothetical protein Poli38472_005746 [Pythium oligandrum]|uniref:Translation elongation factor IF5A C-terminal domain-containing protein n=1 Tax=Pythium oligandrum TaxID=41045 RepID=A0A8K1FS71_PYTOL|nr:hypothetical protein Poli38472_005746 [Pythium oligandrum]|eukprot:TMW68278.1 hypothetical protein Poli38472_005746 [Pythium oligandrum]
MDARCIKYWEDGQVLLNAATSNAQRLPQTMGKMCKELRTMSRFLQKNQPQRFSDNAQQKIVDAVAAYVTFSKQHIPMKTPEEQQLVEATFQVIKDGLAMPFNVFGTKQKKRLMKWYNELIGVVGDPDAALQIEGLEDVAETQRVEWSVLGLDEEGYLSLLNEETGDTCETFQVKKKSADYKKIQKGLEQTEVVVVTLGDDVVEIRVVEE